jgi:hypothetical protein
MIISSYFNPQFITNHKPQVTNYTVNNDKDMSTLLECFCENHDEKLLSRLTDGASSVNWHTVSQCLSEPLNRLADRLYKLVNVGGAGLNNARGGDYVNKNAQDPQSRQD